jgi:allantoin racemase
MPERILVINPNSNTAVTAAMDRVVDPLRFGDGPRIDCTTLEEGPPGIETQRHTDEVVTPLCDLIHREDNATSAFIIACFGDPGLPSATEITDRPVFGICQAGVTTALNYGERYGILTNIDSDVNFGLRYLRMAGIDARLAGIEPIGIPVTGLGEVEPSRKALCEAAVRLKARGAEVLLTGCAGMTPYKADIEAASGLKVIDPIHAAVTLAIGAVCQH